jgi:NADH dehydrogenase FAD-containing subunit
MLLLAAKSDGHNTNASTRPPVLILGGGFAGVGAAQKLGHADADVVLVDKHD